MILNVWETLGTWAIDIGMPVVACYHLLCSGIFLNTAAEDGEGLEKYSNIVLAPFQYVFAGNTAFVVQGDRYELKQRFDYQEHFTLKMGAAYVALPFSVTLGAVMKAIALLFPEARARYKRISKAVMNTETSSKNGYYRFIGIPLSEGPPERFFSLQYPRRQGAENLLSEEKEALKEIMYILKKQKIPFWADCGTCLGAYRYGGVIPWDNDIDISILAPDGANVKQALQALNKTKFIVEDWSNRLLPQTYLRVYVRSNNKFIDIYHYAIHLQTKTLQFILSNESSIFLPEEWKILSKPFQAETPFEEIFPLKMAEFDGMEIPVPNQIKRYLQVRYGENLSPVKIYNEKTDKYEKDLSHPYWERVKEP